MRRCIDDLPSVALNHTFFIWTMGFPQQTNWPAPASFTSTTFPQISHLYTSPTFVMFITTSFVINLIPLPLRFFWNIEVATIHLLVVGLQLP